MAADLQEIVALAFVVLVAGVAFYRRLRSQGAATCHGCHGSSGCGGRGENAEDAASSVETLTSIRPS